MVAEEPGIQAAQAIRITAMASGWPSAADTSRLSGRNGRRRRPPQPSQVSASHVRSNSHEHRGRNSPSVGRAGLQVSGLQSAAAPLGGVPPSDYRGSQCLRTETLGRMADPDPAGRHCFPWCRPGGLRQVQHWWRSDRRSVRHRPFHRLALRLAPPSAVRGALIMRATAHPSAGTIAAFVFKPRLFGPFRQEIGYTLRVFVRAVALCFIHVGLLPPTHDAAKATSVHDVGLTFGGILAQAWRTLNWRSGQQVAVFFAVVAFIVSVGLGFITAFFQEITGSAWAADAWVSVAQSPNIAARWLQGVFGITSAGSPAELGSALGAMLLVYNTTALGIAVLLATYSGIVVVMESAKHGRIGGQRHSMLWAPVRLVFGLGLLAPVSDGWNGGQLAAVWIAGQGSKVASSVWTAFADKIALGQGAIVTPPMASPIEPLVGTLLAIETCAQALNSVAAKVGDPAYIKTSVKKITPSMFGGQYAVESSYDGTAYYPRKACGAIRFVPPENLDYAGEQMMVAAQRDALIAVLPDIQALARQISKRPLTATASPWISACADWRIC
ncbi:MAG: hypothetical protein EPN20_15740 [Magnetospirillum sp.]|nr:MAG: hypothetical protein EPN20_15740 [Magnetospirillum sp.]